MALRMSGYATTGTMERLKELEESLVGKIRQIGFPEVVIDEEGLVSGKLNRAISSARSQKSKSEK